MIAFHCLVKLLSASAVMCAFLAAVSIILTLVKVQCDFLWELNPRLASRGQCRLMHLKFVSYVCTVVVCDK